MVSEVAGRGARFSGKGSMPGSMWDQGPQAAPWAPPQGQGSGSMWDQGAAPRRSMWDQGGGEPDQGPRLVQPRPNMGNQGKGPTPTIQGKMGPQGMQTGTIKTGTVKSYSVVKGFGFILAPEISNDIYFGRDSLQADLRTSDVAGTEVTFELIRAPDGKPQARNLLPIGDPPPSRAQAEADDGDGSRQSGYGGPQDGPRVIPGLVRPPQMQQQGPYGQMGGGPMMGQMGHMMGQMANMMGKGPMGGMGGGCCIPGKGSINPAFMGKPGFMQAMGLAPNGMGMPGRPGFPMMPVKGSGGLIGQPLMGQRPFGAPPIPGAPGQMGQMGQMGMMGPGGVMMGKGANAKRDWSPHAGSRAIKEALKAGLMGAEGADKAARSKSRSSSSKSKRKKSSSSSSRSRSRSRKKKKEKKKKKKKKKRSRSSSSSSSRSSGKKDKKETDEKEEGGASGSAAGVENPAVAKAKMEALEKLRHMQSVEPKEERSKQFRALLREWHPDKNPDKSEVATEVFQFLQKGKSLLNLK